MARRQNSKPDGKASRSASADGRSRAPKGTKTPKAATEAKGFEKELRAFPIVGVGASAGGLEAMKQLLFHLGIRPGLALIYLQHVDPKLESVLAPLFARETSLCVIRAAEGMEVERDHVYVVPPHMDVTIAKGKLRLLLRHSRSERPRPIDHFFESLAQDQGANAIGVVLSGTLTDGAEGIQAIKAAGGVTFAQDEGSAKFDGMPRSAAATGAIDYVLPPNKISQELRRLAKRRPRDAASETAVPGGDPLLRILNLVWSLTGVDFQGYKRPMIRRRVLRRMTMQHIESLEEYADYLRDHPEAVSELHQDLLINVSGFFREPEVFKLLKSKVYPEILRDRVPGTPIRVWVPGCATGEEAYSLAMSLTEHLSDQADLYPVQIFGTDLSDQAIAHARAGVYSAAEVSGVSPERLRRFFRKIDGSYQISKRVRDLCIFAKQNVAKDPPFSKMDLISCQNVLIYLDAPLQRKVIKFFHYALGDSGFLVLGAAENAGASNELFSPLSKKLKIYRKKPGLVRSPIELVASPDLLARERGETRFPRVLLPPELRSDLDLTRQADRVVMSRFAPPGVLVSDRMEIVQFRGQCSAFLQPSPGEASLNLFKMVKEDLAIELRSLLARAGKTLSTVRTEGVRCEFEGASRPVSIEVIPLPVAAEKRTYFLVLFEVSAGARPGEARSATQPGTPAAEREVDQNLMASLHRELAACKDHLRSVIEESEATSEELRAAMEELTSSNEELQSINEELETAKEELQSSNEELTTVNEELQARNIELSALNADLNNFLTSVDIPIVMLSRELAIRRFTQPAAPLLNLIPSDVGRPIGNLRPNVAIPELDAALARAIAGAVPENLEGRDSQGRIYSVRIRPYTGADASVDGAVMSFFDITDRLRDQEALRSSEGKLREALEGTGS